MPNQHRSAIALFVLLLAGAGFSAAVQAADSAVILMYHRFGESQYPSTNITLPQFEAHLRELKSGGHTVLPVPEILDALKAGRPLPDRAIGITIDDAYLSVFTEAWPRFREAGVPFTLFVATDPVDRANAGTGGAGYMTWDQVRELAGAGVAIGSQTASHLHMASSSASRNRADLERSNARFVAELGKRPQLFAYPYGEASLEVAGIVREAGFTAAFGQHSGAMGPNAEPYFLPRFAMNETYGGVDRFRLVSSTLPLPVADVTPADPLIGDNNPPAIGFTVDATLDGIDQLGCFISPDKTHIERLGDTRVEIRVEQPFPKGRTRLNCTIPTADGRWRWYGRQFFFPG